MSQAYVPLARGILRVTLFAIVTSSIFALIYIDAITTGTFGETSLVEISQSVLLLAITGIFIFCALKLPALSNSAWLLATFTAASFVRENDIWLDMLHDEGWQILVAPLIGAGLVRTWLNRAAFIEEQRVYTESASFGLLAAALMTTYLFARLYGMGRFWQAVMQDSYVRTIKDMSEECIELFGYGLLLCAAIEFVALARRMTGAAR